MNGKKAKRTRKEAMHKMPRDVLSMPAFYPTHSYWRTGPINGGQASNPIKNYVRNYRRGYV